MVLSAKILEVAREQKGRHRRPFRPHHPVAGRDGTCRFRARTGGLRCPAADRRATTSRVHTAVKDQSALQPRPERSMSPTLAARSASVSSLLSPEVRELLQEDGPRGVSQGCRRTCPQRSREAPSAAFASAGECPSDRLGRSPAEVPSFTRHAYFRGLGPRRTGPLFDLDAVLPDLELKGVFPKILDDERQGLPLASSSRMRRRCRKDRGRGMVRPEGRDRLLAGRRLWATTSASLPTRCANRACHLLHRCVSKMVKRDGRPNVALADFVAPAAERKRDYVAVFVVTAGIEEVAIANASSGRTTTIPRSW